MSSPLQVLDMVYPNSISKSKARKRLAEALRKCQLVYMGQPAGTATYLKTPDMIAIEKILTKCINNLK